MRSLGLYSEFDDSWGKSRSIRLDLQPDMSEAIRRKIAFYLVRGTPVRFSPGRTPDVLDGEIIYLTEGLLSDGEWFWRADLAHYLLKYGLALPADFLMAAEQNMWMPPALSEDEQIAASVDVREVIERSWDPHQ